MISIIGAGPVGSFLAYLLSKNGFEVDVFEEHSEIGMPVQCTGLLSDEINKIIKVEKECIVNKIGKARIFSKDSIFSELRLKENIIIDRRRFDNSLAKMAIDSGAKFHFNSRFKGLKADANKGSSIKIKIEKRDLKTRRVQERILKTNFLIGADGPLSSVAKSAEIFGIRKFFKGIQIVCRHSNDNVIEFFLMKKGIGWLVPENNEVVRVGVAFEEGVREGFYSFLKKRFGDSYKRKLAEKREINTGLIPIFNPLLKIQKGNVFLVGDAAAQVNAATFGGIVPGLKAAALLQDSLVKKESYLLKCIRGIYPDLFASLVVRRILNNCSERDLDFFVKTLNEKGIRDVLLSINRNNMLALGIKAIIKEPRLLYLIRGLV